MGQFLLITGGAVTLLLILWYFGWARYNQRKGKTALYWIESACLGRARVVEQDWKGMCKLHARIRFASLWLDNARVTVHLSPRPVPVQWAISAWRGYKETLTLEADLENSPGIQLDLYRHRWVSHKQIRPSSAEQKWTISRPGPIVLTTRTHWAHELTPVVNTLMTSRGHNLLSVRFRRQSPHLAATIDLDALSDEKTTASFLSVLRDLAAGASAHRQ